MVANAEILIIGGSETTASLLSGVTYLLLENEEAYHKLVEEVRSTFQREDEITLVSVNKLSYMLACLDEGMRMYPPIANGLPRCTPKNGAQVLGHYIPGNVCWFLDNLVECALTYDRHMCLYTSGHSIAERSTLVILTHTIRSVFSAILDSTATGETLCSLSTWALGTVLGGSTFELPNEENHRTITNSILLVWHTVRCDSFSPGSYSIST